MKKKIVLAIACLILIMLSGMLIRRHFHFYVKTPSWTIGLYQIDDSLRVSEYVSNPVLTAQSTEESNVYFVADPFVTVKNGQYYMFYEKGVKSDITAGWQGVIGCAVSKNGVSWTDSGTVLEDKISVSFPIVFDYEEDTYMTISNDGSYEGYDNVRLFKAVNFPDNWVCVDTLLTGLWKDPSVYIAGTDFYIFTSTPSHDAHIFHSNSLRGPYTEHPASPIVRGNKTIGRNAGNVFTLGGVAYRPVQDCSNVYGESVRLLRINYISPNEYIEEEVSILPFLSGTGDGWNSKRLHTMNLFRKLDGTYNFVTDGSTIMTYNRSIRIRKRK